MSPRVLVSVLLALMVVLPGGATAAARYADQSAGSDFRSTLPRQVQVHLTPAPSDPAPRSYTVVPITDQVYKIDLARLGVHPLDHPLPLNQPQANPLGLPRLLSPDGGAIGLGGAFMSVSPDVVSQSVASEVAVLSANWMPSETVAFSVNGGTPTNVTASLTGRVGIYVTVNAGQGWITFEQRGLTSGQQTGGVVEVQDAAAPLPGLAIAPHAINPNGASTINVLGTRWKPGNVTLARNSTAINTLTAGASGTFYYSINVAAGADTSAIYSAYTTTTGSRVGQSIEERADAGVPPYGDQNVVRALVDRPVVDSSGGTLSIVGEGFQSGETVNVSGCGTLSGTADGNGAYRFFDGVSGTGVAQCVLTGAVSGRVARASTLGSADAVNAPGIILAPAAVGGTGNVTLIIDRLLPNQSGTVYRDGVSLGSFSTDSSGKAAAFVGKPASGFIHDYRWIGASGQSVSAPLLYIPAGGTPTHTPTATGTPTHTPTNTAVPPTSTSTRTPTDTPTRTPTDAPLPTQTPGGPSATPVPSNTPVPPSTATNMPTNTPLPTQTPGGPSATPVPSNTPVPPSTATNMPTNTPPPGATATPCAVNFSDVYPTDYFYTPVQYLACHGVISGYADGTFRPFANTTRAQMVKIVVLGFQKASTTPTGSEYTFADVPRTFPFFAVIETAAAGNIVSGYGCGGPDEPCDAQHRPYFRPYANVTRGQLSKIDVVAAGWALQNPGTGTFADVAPGSAFYPFVETAYCHSVVSGYGCGGASEPCDPQQRPYFRQYNQATRGQIAKIVYLSVTAGGTCAGPAAPQ